MERKTLYQSVAEFNQALVRLQGAIIEASGVVPVINWMADVIERLNDDEEKS